MLAALNVNVSSFAQNRTLVFDVDDVGEVKRIETWGLDTAWLWDQNVIRGVAFMGKPQVDVIRFSFTGDEPIVNGDLTSSRQGEFDERMRIVDTYTEADTGLYFNNDSEGIDPYFSGTNGVNPARWAELIDLTRRKVEAAGREVVSVAPFNEPDFAPNKLGGPTRMREVVDILRNDPLYKDDWASIRLSGGNTLNNDVAISYYSPNKDLLDEGATHQLAGSFDTYASFMSYVADQGDWATNDELHNVMEAMVGAEYGMNAGIWWGTAEYARGEFVKTSDGVRLAYAEHRPNWTAASVYRSPEGKVQAFVGESERQARPTTYQFVSKDRDVYFDGIGPQRRYTVRTTGGIGYQTEDHKNAERVIQITWGDDIQPAIDGRYTLVNRQSGKVMEVAGGSSENGANIQQADPSYATHQSWLVDPVAKSIGGDWSYYTVKPFHNTLKTGDVWDWNLDAGADVRLYDYAGGSNQQWILEYVEDGYFYLRSRYSGKYLEVAGGASENGANVQLGDGPGGHQQQWRLLPAGALVEFDVPATPSGLKASPRKASVSLEWEANAESDLSGYHVYRSLYPDEGYELIARNVVGNSFVDQAANDAGVNYYYYVRAIDKSLNRSQPSVAVVATPTVGDERVLAYDFEQSLEDLSGNANDALASDSAGYVGGKLGANALYFNGATFHADLPATVANYEEITISTWIYWSGGAENQRVYEFSDGEGSGFSLTPKSAEGELRFVINAGEQEYALTSTALNSGEWTHVALSIDGAEGRMFVDGELVDTKEIALSAADIRPFINSLGKGEDSADPLFRGRLDDFEVYNFAIDAEGARALAGLQTPGIPSSLMGEFEGDAVFLSWSAVAGATSYTVKRATASDGPFEAIVSGLTSASYVDGGLGDSFSYFYRVVPTNAVGEGGESESLPVATVSPGDQWRMDNFGTTEASGDAADMADPDADGIVNLLERAFGGDPNRSDPDVLPQVDTSSPVISILYRKSNDASDLRIAVEESVDHLTQWTDAVGIDESVTQDEEIEIRRFTRSFDGEGALFLRLSVETK